MKTLKRILITATCLLALTALTVNAEEPTNVDGSQRSTQVRENASGRSNQEQKSTSEKRAQMKENFTEIVTTYAPDMVDDFEAIDEELAAIREEIRATGILSMDTSKEELKEEAEAIKADYTDEDSNVDREGLQAAMEDFRAQVKEDVDATKEAIKATYADEFDALEANREVLKGYRQELKAAREAEDDEAIVDAIEDIYDALEDRVDLRQDLLDAMTDDIQA